MMDFNIVLFDNFETLDAFGPAEIIGRIPNEPCKLQYYSIEGEVVISSQNVAVNTCPFSEMSPSGVLLIPGGPGTRTLVKDMDYILAIERAAINASYVLTVCTGSAILAKTKLLDGRQATSNKRAFDWVKAINEKVNWVKKARWVVDGKYYTSSGVSAGMDMTLGFIEDRYGKHVAIHTADSIEYIWHSDKNTDPFFI